MRRYRAFTRSGAIKRWIRDHDRLAAQGYQPTAVTHQHGLLRHTDVVTYTLMPAKTAHLTPEEVHAAIRQARQADALLRRYGAK